MSIAYSISCIVRSDGNFARFPNFVLAKHFGYSFWSFRFYRSDQRRCIVAFHVMTKLYASGASHPRRAQTSSRRSFFNVCIATWNNQPSTRINRKTVKQRRKFRLTWTWWDCSNFPFSIYGLIVFPFAKSDRKIAIFRPFGGWCCILCFQLPGRLRWSCCSRSFFNCGHRRRCLMFVCLRRSCPGRNCSCRLFGNDSSTNRVSFSRVMNVPTRSWTGADDWSKNIFRFPY